MNLKLQRKKSANGCTHGDIFNEGIPECFSLEDEVRPDGIKIPGQTAIPVGRYRVIVTFSNRFQKNLPLLENVPNFTGVRIHAGNSSADTEGCILVGQVRSVTTVLHSRAALEILQAKIEQAITAGNKVWIEIKNTEE